MNQLTIFLNNDPVFEFDRETSFADEQLAFLDTMDSDMDKGIKVYGELLSNPDSKQRATFVVMNFIKALQQESDSVIMASCAYLTNRFPLLIEVHATNDDKTVKVELIEEESH